MNNLSEKIKKDSPSKGEVFLYWLGGTSFIIKGSKVTIGLDLYLSDACENEKGDYKRLVPSPVQPEEINLDYLIATHDHGDHFDTGSLDKLINKGTITKLIGPTSVINAAKKIGLDKSKLIKLDRNENIQLDDISFQGVFADHGINAPDCIGIIIGISKKNIYFTSDTCYRPDLPELVPLLEPIDLLIVPINGKWGNPDSKDASYITSWVNPGIVVPSHFWLFKEHGGDPGQFVEFCSLIAPKTRIEVLAIGEKLSF